MTEIIKDEYSTSIDASRFKYYREQKSEWNGWDDFIAYNIDATNAISSGSTTSVVKVYRDDPWMCEDYYYINTPPPIGIKGDDEKIIKYRLMIKANTGRIIK